MTGASKELLIISGKPTQEDLQFGWDSILEELSSLVETQKTKSILECWKRINENEKKIEFLESALEYLKPYYDPVLNKRVPNWDEDIVNQIVELGYDYIEQTDDLEKYERKLWIVHNEVKTLIIITNNYYNQYAALCPKIDESEIERSEMAYEKEIVILSKYQGSRIEKEEITCFEFFAIKNTYMDEYERQKRK